MKITIDLKSALCGLIVGVATMFVVGAGTSSNPAGKYKIVTGFSGNQGYVVMVDTQTGEAWSDELKTHNSSKSLINNAAGFWDEKR